jgi:hypothetical protein|tara:strand:+ start:1584 stop:1760 length:177 start_codon:yes stop_codon:yes gene_type:complete
MTKAKLTLRDLVPKRELGYDPDSLPWHDPRSWGLEGLEYKIPPKKTLQELIYESKAKT